jgi:predicted flap endonuclease-1-like 5' DNA nuclease
MASLRELPSAAAVEEGAQRAWRLPVGVVSPLWAVFGAAASVGVAYWWMTRWTRAVNVEALASFQLAAPAQPVETLAEPVPVAVEEAAVEAPVEAAPIVAEEPVAEAPVAAAAEIEAVVEELPEPPAPDDLTRMTGIGPKLSVALAERGVTRFADIAAWTAKDLAEVDAALSLKGRAVREAWVAQAKRLAGA